MSGRTYGRQTGWMVSGDTVIRVRIGVGGTHMDGQVYLQLYPFGGDESESRLVPPSVTGKLKADAMRKLDELGPQPRFDEWLKVDED